MQNNTENFEGFMKERLLSLPPEIQKAFSETDIVGEIEKIRQKYKLMYDQASVLETETMIVFLGLEDPKHLIRNITENAKIPVDLAGKIVEDIEANILKQIKGRLVEIMQEEDKEAQKNPQNKELPVFETKEDILQQIENPVPNFPPPAQAPKPEEKKIEQPATATEIQNYTPPAVPTKSIVEQKLSQPVRIPPLEKEISSSKLPEISQKSQPPSSTYSKDPYKEPIA